MISRVIDFSVRHSTAIFAAAVVWAVAGVWAVWRTPMDAVPDLSENQVLVYADWPGHGPVEFEANVTRTLSSQLQGLAGAVSVRGSSDVGTSTLHVIFDDSVDFREARRRVQEALAGLPDLPAGVTPRLAAEGIPTGQIFWYTVDGSGRDLAELRSLQDTVIAPQLRSVPGVAEVASVGGFVAECHVEIDPQRLSAAGLNLSAVGEALQRSLATTGGRVLAKGNAEFLVQVRPPQFDETGAADPRLALEQTLIPRPDGAGVRLAELGRVAMGAAPRRGMFERDGNEAVAGIVHLRYGHNPLEVTRGVKKKLREIAAGLPEGIRLVPCYDRTPLIQGAVSTVTQTLVESMLVAALCVLVILRHFRASFVVTLTLPLAALGAFLGMWLLRAGGLADIQTNIMSIAGIVASIGVLVDSSIVIAENCLHRLHEQFGDSPVRGNVRETVAAACRRVGPPAFFAIAIMLVSFLPVFSLEGIDGRMYRPLAWTKTLALLSVAVLSITLVPALCAVLLRGRVRAETASGVVRTVIAVYRPVLNSLLDRPGPLWIVLAITFILAAAATGSTAALKTITAICLGGMLLVLRRPVAFVPAMLLLLATAISAANLMTPIARELRMPLDEGMVMDMPITVPRASIAQSADDLKARNMVLCRFPEVHMVTGKAGRAETPFDPAPLDMIETMVEFRPRAWWPKRRILPRDARTHARAVLAALVDARLIEKPADAEALIVQVVDEGLPRYDALQREVAWQRTQALLTDLGRDLSVELARRLASRLQAAGLLSRPLQSGDGAALATSVLPQDVRLLAMGPTDLNVAPTIPRLFDALASRGWLAHSPEQSLAAVSAAAGTVSIATLLLGETSDLETALAADLRGLYESRWRTHAATLNGELLDRAPGTWTHVVCDELLSRVPLADEQLVKVRQQVLAARYQSGPEGGHHAGGHTGLPPLSKLPIIDPHPRYDAIIRDQTRRLAGSLLLWPHDAQSLTAFGGEMDRAVQMPGWTNVWTRPIQNRVDMLATGVNSEVGVRVKGRDLDAVVEASEQVAAALRDLPGAANVVADPIRGKGMIEIVPDARRAGEWGVSPGDLSETIEAALGGQVIVRTADFGGKDGASLPVRVQLSPGLIADEDDLRRLPVRRTLVAGEEKSISGDDTVPLDRVATVRVADGPATIKSEDGWLRNYVRLNVTGQDASAFVEQARRVVQSRVKLPHGVFVEWTGQYLHSERTQAMLLRVVPVVLLLIGAILFVTYRDWADAGLMLLSAPAALAGGVLCQWLLGFPFSVAVGVGYIACFGMAAATGIVMLVYLREAVEQAGGLERMTLPHLREAVLTGAVHRLRPKLLTEITTVFSLAPMLWSTGVGSDVIRPMAAPVLGGILIADEVIDLLLPILFYHVRRLRWQRLHAHLEGAAKRPDDS